MEKASRRFAPQASLVLWDGVNRSAEIARADDASSQKRVEPFEMNEAVCEPKLRSCGHKFC